MPRRLANELLEHEVRTVPDMGWADLDDGPLLDVMSGLFDVLVTVDKSLPKQQRVHTRPFGIIILRAKPTGWLTFFLWLRCSAPR